MRGERGFTYLGLLLAIAVLGLGLSAASEVWETTARRQKLEQLEFVGQQYAAAIGSYYEVPLGGGRRFPPNVSDLLEDRRQAFTRRHLRQAYVNPLSGLHDWEFMRAPDGGIRGLRVEFRLPEGARTVREFVYLSGH